MSIYTKTGDKGKTSLYGGKRVSKSDPQVDVYGTVDELNSWMGLLVSEINNADWKEFLAKIQTDLMTIGSTLAGWKGDLSDLPKRVTQMEKRIDKLDKDLPPLRNFILPGGSRLSAFVHITRSVCRRVERKLVMLFNQQSTISNQQKSDQEKISQYLNRLSDLFFMLARFINKTDGILETKWSAIKND